MHVHRQILGWLSLVTLTAACGGGGDGGTAGPAGVASVQLTATASTLEVGASISTVVRLTDAQGRTVTDRPVSYQSSAPNIATVSTTGIVTGVAPGSVTISATAEGKTGSLALTVTAPAVGLISIDQRTPSVRQGESTTLTAKVYDNAGRELTGRTVAWSSAVPTIATITNAGVVTGVATGSAFIRAESEGKRDSVPLRVRSLTPPTIAATAPATWTPGATATIDGTNFSTNAAANEVYISGARATVTAATATRLTITVPAAAQLPCLPTGPTPIVVVVNGDSASGSAGLQMATARTLAAGQSLLLTSQNDILCNEFSGTGGTYLITAFNSAESPNTRSNFSVIGAATTATAAQVLTARSPFVQPALQGVPLRLPAVLERRLKQQHTHLDILETERRFMSGRRNPVALRQQRAKLTGSARLAAAAAPVPNVGDMLNLRMRRTLDDILTFDNIRGRVVYVGPKLVIVEDSAAPLARTMDAEFDKIGREFDTQMYGFLSYFGDPLAVDSLTDANGRLIAVFSRRVNQYRNGEILGFVTICDFFDNTGPPEDICPSSNVGEYFYAIVPDPNATNGFNVEQWRRFMRGTLIHEAKHITAYSERLLRALSTNIVVLEESWLEEATAQQAAELWARAVYGIQWKSDAGWAAGPRCDYAPIGAVCTDPVEGILGHFVWLYQYYDQQERKSMLSSANSDGSIYGSSWSFARWVTDTYGSNESAFLRSLVQVSERGVTNISGRAGRPFAELLGYWSLASLADNYPGVSFSDPRLQLVSWNSRDLFSAMNQFLRFSDGRVAFPKPFPLTIRPVTFGNWTPASQDVIALSGGSFAAWELTGAQTRPQVLGLRGVGGGAPPANVGLAIVRVQ